MSVNSIKNSMKNLIRVSLAFCLILALGGCAGKSNELYMDISDTLNEAGEADNLNGEEKTDPQAVTEMEPNIYVYVCGAVNNPGVYELSAGSRLYEAVEMAGGMSEGADETYLNMARELTDGEQVVVYTADEVILAQEKSEAEEKESGLVNINTADISELTTLSGIGESRAEAIIDYREKNGAFSSIEDIKNVDGIKDGLFSKIKDKITV